MGVVIIDSVGDTGYTDKFIAIKFSNLLLFMIFIIVFIFHFYIIYIVYSIS